MGSFICYNCFKINSQMSQQNATKQNMGQG